MKVPYIDLQAQFRSLESELSQAVLDVLASGGYVLGPKVVEFEESFAAYCESAHALGVSCGTDALVLALRAAGIGPGDEVITAANTFIATVAAIEHVGATPVLVDVAEATRNIDPELVTLAITDRTRAIIPVHLYGRMAPMDAITQIADESDLVVIEDAAQAQGSRYHGSRAGSLGQLAGFSFYPAKNLGACGEAGAVTTNDDELAARVRQLRDHGSSRKYHHEVLGYNARMDAIQGAVLNIKLKHLDQWNESRRDIAARYDGLLAGLPLVLPAVDPDCEQVYHVYVVESDLRDDLQAFLGQRGVPTIIHYPIPVHLQPSMKTLDHGPGSFEVTEKLAQTALSLPIFPEMTVEQVEYVAACVREFFERS